MNDPRQGLRRWKGYQRDGIAIIRVDCLPGGADGGVKPSQGIDQTILGGLKAGPNMTAPDRVDLFNGHVPPSRDPGEKGVIALVEHRLGMSSLIGREARGRRGNVRIPAVGDMVPGQADLLPQTVKDDLAAEDTDRSRDRAGLGDDFVRASSDVIAA